VPTQQSREMEASTHYIAKLLYHIQDLRKVIELSAMGGLGASIV